MSWHPSAATSSYVRASSMSVCSLMFPRCTFTWHCIPCISYGRFILLSCASIYVSQWGGFSSFLCSYCYLVFSLPTCRVLWFGLCSLLRFRWDACATSAEQASLFLCRCGNCRFLLWLFLIPMVKGASFQSFTCHLFLHSRSSLCTHNAVSSVRSYVLCVHIIWLLRILYIFTLQS